MARKARRKTFWLAKTFEYQGIGTGSGLTGLVLATDAQLHVNGSDPTIIRIVGRLWYSYERKGTGFQESTHNNVWAGIYCLHTDVTTQSPRDDLDEEHWMWTGFMASWSTFVEFPSRQFDSNTVIGGSTESRGSIHNNSGASMIDIDARSMRKAPEPCQMILALRVVENLSETASDHKLNGYVRILLKV